MYVYMYVAVQYIIVEVKTTHTVIIICGHLCIFIIVHENDMTNSLASCDCVMFI